MAPEHSYRVFLLLDIERFNDPDRDDQVRARLRRELQVILDHALADVGIPKAAWSARTTGDGLALVIDPAIPAAQVVRAGLERLPARLVEYNRVAVPIAQVRVRAVVHAGHVLVDEDGDALGEQLNIAFRLLDGDPLRRCLKQTDGPLVIGVSDEIYRQVVRQRSLGLDPAAFVPILVRAKETSAWVWASSTAVESGQAQRREARDAVTAWVAAGGTGIGHDTSQTDPQAFAAWLFAGVLAPFVAAEAGRAGADAGLLPTVLARLGTAGSPSLARILDRTVERLRRPDDNPVPLRAAHETLTAELFTHLATADEAAALVRTEVASTLRAIGAVEAAFRGAIQTGAEELQRDLAAAFARLGATLEEFRWVQEDLPRTLQRIQQELTARRREQRQRADLTLRSLTTVTGLRHEVAGPDGPPAVSGEGDRRGELPTTSAPPCPYRGLAAYRLEDARWFFGREDLTAVLVSRLAERLAGPCLLAVIGPSGSGKSSLLRAGLLPALQRGALPVPDSSRWPWVLLTPGQHPLDKLAARVGRLAGVDLSGADLLTSPDQLVRAAQAALTATLAEDDDAVTGLERTESSRLVVIVDQLEELFTLGADERERAAFLRALSTLAGGSPGRAPAAVVVVGVRADFYDRCVAHAQFAALLQEHTVLVGPMSTAELKRAIRKPAEVAGLTLQEGLVEVLLHDLGAGSAGDAATYDPGALPLLSYALFATWQQRQGDILTLDAYHKTGGIHGAIAANAEALYQRLDSAGRAEARRLLLELVAVGEDTADTRRRAERATLLSGGDPDTAAMVLDRLIRARLVTVEQDRAEIAHEALLRAWPRLQTWLAEDRARLRARRHLTADAEEWDQLGRDPGALYRGARLAIAREWVASDRHDLTNLERAFLTESIALAEREEQRERRSSQRLRWLTATLGILLVIALASGALAFQQSSTARQQRRVAVARQLVAEATLQQSTNAATAQQLVLAAWRIAPNAQTRQALLSTQAHPSSSRLLGHTDEVAAVAFSPDGSLLASAAADQTVRLWDLGTARPLATLTGHNGKVRGVAFNPDGETLASGGADGTVRLWDVASRAAIGAPLTGHTYTVWSVAFSPDGQTLASAGTDGTVRLWDVASRAPIGEPLIGHDDTIRAVAFSPDGRLIASAGADRKVVLWDVRARRRLGAPLTEHTDTITSVRFSPDGRILASGGFDQAIRLWDVRRHQPLGAPITGHTSGVWGVAFSPDGRILASASYDQTIRLWSLPARTPIGHPLTGHTKQVWGLAFSPDGRMLASAGFDRTIRLWDIPVRIPGHTGPVYGLAFSPDGRILASVSLDRTVRLWDIRTRQPLGDPLTGHAGGIWGVAFSRDGRTLATVGQDRTVRLWDVPTRQPLGGPLTGHAGGVWGVAFSPDGRTLATVGDDRTVRLWDVPTRQPLGRPLTGHTRTTWAVAFSPAGDLLGSASFDQTIRLWNPRSRSSVATLTGHTEPVTSVAFSPDGRLLASASFDQTIRLWDPRRRTRVATLTGHAHAVTGVAFSPDSQTLASASYDHTIRLWNLNRRVTTSTLTGHTNTVWSVTFSPDGRLLASGDENGAAVIWRLDHRQVIGQLCAHAGMNLTREEWRRYVPDLPYQDLCP